MSGTNDDDLYVTTRDELSEEVPAGRTRKARATVADNPAADEPEAPQQSPDDAVAAMARQVKDAERRAAEAERRNAEWQRERDELVRGKTQAESEALTGQERALDLELRNTQEQIAALRRVKRQAREVGDLDAEDTADAQLTEATARKLLLERDKNEWVNWRKQQETEAAAKPRQEPKAAPVQQDRDERGLSKTDLEWVAKHPGFEDDADCNAWIRTHAKRATDDGIVAGSPAFYREMSKAYDRFQKLRKLEDGGEEPVAQEAPAPRPRAAPSSASMAPSPSRSGGGSAGSRDKAPNADAVARRLGVTVDEMRQFAGKMGMDAYVKQQARELGMV